MADKRHQHTRSSARGNQQTEPHTTTRVAAIAATAHAPSGLSLLLEKACSDVCSAASLSVRVLAAT